MGDRTKPFTIYVISEALTDPTYSDDAAPTAGTYTVQTLNSETPFIELTLKHGESVRLKNLPEGSYTISEAATGESYTVTYTGKSTPESGTAVPVSDADEDADGLQFTLDADTAVTVNNDLPLISPTGVTLRYIAYLLMLLAGASLLMVSRRKRRG